MLASCRRRFNGARAKIMYTFENNSPYTGDELLRFLSGGLDPDLGQDAGRVGLGQSIEQAQ
jgi:hypothetical protein